LSVGPEIPGTAILSALAALTAAGVTLSPAVRRIFRVPPDAIIG
jgi:hypothetical protein